ncbi:ty3-gypsy retrotransposon protein [Tanacetum coccineum]|uniref:Ty3-gypsy retrotransposon protein n=1 Tax=Tanacetum coccineum TaxID=301880 RepID=A0ABQ5CPG0_9ASTR
MDEAAVRRMLKDQTDAIYVELHTQLAALQVELQGSKSLGLNRHGAGGDPEAQIEPQKETRPLPRPSNPPKGKKRAHTKENSKLQGSEARLGDQGVSSELVKPALSVAPPKPTSNSDEDADADQDNPEDQGDALESEDISILNSLIGHVDLYVLPMKGPDVMLGIQWLQKLGKVTHDYVEQTMEFILEGIAHTLQGDASLRIKQISLHNMQALLDTNDIYGMYELHGIQGMEDGTEVQQGEMEKSVNEMLSQGIIQFSHSPFSSPVLLVRKNDESYHFCVDYRALNAVTVKDKFPILTSDEMFDELGLEADASAEAIGAVLLQKGQPISFFSRKLGPHMRVAATYQKELFAIIEAVIQTPLQQKYVRKLMGFDFVIEYKHGVSNQVADALSKMYEGEADNDTATFMAMSQPLIGLLNDLKRENETLEELCHLHHLLNQGEQLDGFCHEQGLLIYQDRYFVGAESKLKDLFLAEFHNTPSAGHGGTKKMLTGLSALFYWRGMPKSVEEFIRNCLVCQQTKYSTQATKGLLQHLSMPMAVWEDVSMDFITELPRFQRIDDRDPIFISKFWRQLFEASGTQLKHSTTYHPQTDGQMEVVNQGLEQYLRALVFDRPYHWVRFLRWAEFSYNTSFHSSIKMTPYQALYERMPPTIIPYPAGASKVATIDELLLEQDALLRQLKNNLLATKNRMEMKANRKRRDNAQIIHVFYGVICIYSIISREPSILNSLKLLVGSLEDIPRIDTTKSNTYTLKNTSFKKRSTIKLYVPNVRRTCHLCVTLIFKSKIVNIALTQQVHRTIFCVCRTSHLI